MAAIEDVLRTDPNCGMALYLLGMAAGEEGDADRAVALLLRAAESEPQNADIRSHLARKLRDLGDLAGASVNFARAVALAPQRADLAYGLGAGLVKTYKSAQGLLWLLRALAAEPNYFESLMAAGTLLHLKGDDVAAVKILTRAVQANPDNPDAYVLLGQSMISADMPLEQVAVPFLAVANRFPKLHRYHPPIVQYFHDIGDEPTYERYAKNMVDIQLAEA
ncbi:MAG: tetratricopeptide repeat protein, partial [Proteobacteria bacterium]|nr:tetratricopeptide repeat protein [Pseudomonadota bacterium]